MDIKELEKIVSILKQNDVTEFELEENGTHLRLNRGAPHVVTNGYEVVKGTADIRPAITVAHPVSNGVDSSQKAASNEADLAFDRSLTKIESPIVGTFYRKSSPDAAPFVNVGSVVKKGDTLCIVEAMKLMNPIEAPTAGKIEKILVNDAQVVEYGEVLFLINPNA